MADTSANRLESTLGGVRLEARPHQLSAWAIVGLRLVMGWVMLSAGWGKFTGGFSAYGFLSNVDPASPASGVFGAMAENASMMAAVDVIVPATQMVLFYLGSWGVAGGVVNDQFVYAAVFLALGAFAAGRVLGVDRSLEEHSLVERVPTLRYLLG